MASPTVLLADDEAHITCVVSQKLRSAGFNVVTARDGAEAFELACKARPDLVVTDLQMPHLSGLELAIKLRQTPLTARTPIIMLTARGYILEPDALAQTNIKHLMPKPFSVRDVLRRVIEILGNPQANAKAEAA